MTGSATLTIVTSSSSMNVAEQTATSVHHLLMQLPYRRRRAPRLKSATSVRSIRRAVKRE